MAVIDWLDDVVDRVADRRTGAANIVLRFGLAESLLLTLVALCAAVITHANLTGAAFVALALVSLLSEWSTQQLWKTEEEEEPFQM